MKSQGFNVIVGRDLVALLAPWVAENINPGECDGNSSLKEYCALFPRVWSGEAAYQI